MVHLVALRLAVTLVHLVVTLVQLAVGMAVAAAVVHLVVHHLAVVMGLVVVQQAWFVEALSSLYGGLYDKSVSIQCERLRNESTVFDQPRRTSAHSLRRAHWQRPLAAACARGRPP